MIIIKKHVYTPCPIILALSYIRKHNRGELLLEEYKYKKIFPVRGHFSIFQYEISVRTSPSRKMYDICILLYLAKNLQTHPAQTQTQDMLVFFIRVSGK